MEWNALRVGMFQGNALKWSMLRIDEAGIFSKFLMKYKPNVVPSLSGNTNREPIFKFTEFFLALLVLAYGYCPGCAVLLLEIL